MMTNEERDAVAEAKRDDVSPGMATERLPGELQNLDERERVQAMAHRDLFVRQEHGLRQSYADWILRILGAQLLVADAVFVAIAWVGRGWDLTPGMTEAWLLAAVVQVVAVVAIVTRHLFPDRGGDEVRV
jgi:hypothetical protein